jgi:hypothetical protein
MATDAQRSHLKALMEFFVGNKVPIDYLQVRPMVNIHYYEHDYHDLFPNHHVAMDCSESVTCLCKMAGLKDPNGSSYNGYGSSETMWQHLPHYTNPAGAHIGALVVYGHGGEEHVSMVYQPGPDPLLFSHGGNDGPKWVHLSEESKWHASPAVLLDMSPL